MCQINLVLIYRKIDVVRDRAAPFNRTTLGRVKDAPTLPAGVRADQLRRGESGPWSKGRR